MSAITDLSVSVLLGMALGLGIALVLSALPRWAAPTLSRRIAPYVRDVADPRGLTPIGAVSAVRGLSERVARAFGGESEGLARRLAHAGATVSPVGFRGRQLGWGVGGFLAGALVGVTASLVNGAGPGALLLAPLGAAVALAVVETGLTRAARRRRARIQDELPTVLEFLALCLAAGEGLRDALRRVGEVGTGELTAEVRRVVLESGTGSSLTDALTAAADRVDLPALGRAVEHLVAAIDRGAPLSQVLQDQAADARDDAKRHLIELAGKKEIAMLLPLVFLLLPLSVMFAVFPGIVMLRLGGG